MEDLNSKIKKYIIKNCPLGQTKEVFSDMAKLIPDFTPESPDIIAMMKEFNEEHLAIARGDNNTKYVITQTGAQDNYYIDQRSNQKHIINHIDSKIVSSEPLDMVVDETIKIYRDELEKKLNKYRDDFYKEQEFGVFVYG